MSEIKKTYADVCLELAENVKRIDEYEFIYQLGLHARTDIPELARRLKLACQYLDACDYRVGNKRVVEELEATPEVSE